MYGMSWKNVPSTKRKIQELLLRLSSFAKISVRLSDKHCYEEEIARIFYELNNMSVFFLVNIIFKKNPTSFFILPGEQKSTPK